MRVQTTYSKFDALFSSMVIKKPGTGRYTFKDLGCFVGEKNETVFWIKKKRVIPSNIPQRAFYGRVFINEDEVVTIVGNFRFSLKTYSVLFAVLCFSFLFGTRFFPLNLAGIMKNMICSMSFPSLLLGFSLLTSIKEEQDTIKLIKSISS